MKLSDIYQNRFLSPLDVGEEGLLIRLTSIGVEELQSLVGKAKTHKIVADFETQNGDETWQQSKKQFVIGKANAKIIAKQVSDDTEDWVGLTMQLGTVMTQFGDSISIFKIFGVD